MSDRDDSPAAAGPGPGAPGATAEDGVAGSATDAEQDGVNPATQNPPFRTPEPGARNTTADLGERD